MPLTPAKIKALAADAAKYGPDLRYPTSGETDDDDEGEYEIEVEPGVFHVVSTKNPKADAQERTALRKAAFKAQQELRAEWMQFVSKKIADDPGKFKGLKAFGNIQVLPKSSGNTRRTYERIIQRILTRAGASETQTAISAEIQTRYPDSPPYKDWTKAMSKSALESLRKRIQAAEPPFNEIRITSKTTLATLHRKAANLLAREGAQIKATILITHDHVFIGERSWRIGNATANGRTYRRINVRVDNLLELHKPSARRLVAGQENPID